MSRHEADGARTSSRRSCRAGSSDYERYLRTDELLALQKLPEERAHHDELLFQTTHQSRSWAEARR